MKYSPKLRVVMISIFFSLVVAQVIIMTTYGDTSEGKVGIMMTQYSQSLYC